MSARSSHPVNAPNPGAASQSAKPWEHAKAGEGSASDPLAARFVESLSYDTRLYEADIRGSLAHAAMLEAVGLISAADLEAIRLGLAEIKSEIEAAGVTGWSGWKVELEDVHMCIEAALIAKVGDAGRKLHTGRSRNDQVALDLRLWLRDAAGAIVSGIDALRASLTSLAAGQGTVVLPGYTHMQRAQPITLGAELAAWHAMFTRDRHLLDRLCAQNTAECPIGSGALAGSTLPLDRAMVAASLGFDGPSPSSIDSTASRDEALDFLYGLARTAMHLSRLAEQWILYCTTEFGVLKLDERFTTGSSMMPQKRNPDMLELIRGRCGGIYGHLTALLTICKGLPIGYNRDLQEDKRHVFAAFDTVSDCLAMAARIVESARFDPEAIRSAGGGLDRGHLDATILAERLVLGGVPFRTAHQVVGALVQVCDSSGRSSLSELEPRELVEALRSKNIAWSAIDASAVIAALGAENAVLAYRSSGHAGLTRGGYQDALRARDHSAPPAPVKPAKRAVTPPPESVRATEPAPVFIKGPPPPVSVAALQAEGRADEVRPATPILRKGRSRAAAVDSAPPAREPSQPLFASDDPAGGTTVSQFNQKLIAAYVEVGRTLDDLPYTEDFLHLCAMAGAADAGMGEQAVFRRLQNIRKAGKLPTVGRAPSRPPRLSEGEEQWLAAAVVESVGSLGQRDQLPFTPRFELLLNRFNQTTGRSLDPHDLWRVIAKLAK
ncbi:MAG: argininosuccinate lyase [Phycisphaerales bacterium]